MGSWGVLLLALAFQGTPSPAQDALPSEVRVLGVEASPSDCQTGEEMELRVRLALASGVSLSPPDTLSHLPGFRALGKGSMIATTQGDNGLDGDTVRLSFPLQPLRPGTVEFPPLRVRVDREGSDQGPEWALLELGSLVIRARIPEGESEIFPAPPVFLEGSEDGGLGGFALLGMMVGLGTGILALALRRARTGETGWVSDSGAGYEVPEARVPDAAEIRRRLDTLLERELGGEGGSERGWEEAVVLYRTLLLATLNQGPRGQTTPEILLALQGGEESLVREILQEGDRMRFGGAPVAGVREKEALLGIRRWLEGTDA